VSADLKLIEEKIQQREINTKLGEIPTKKEIKTAINKSKTNKAPGFSGVTTDMLKNMPEEGLDIITHLIQTYWTNAECDYDSWHKQNIRSLYKGKGEPKDPNNWRGICLKETTAKVVSSIIAQRLIKQLDDIGLPTQYGNVGCQEAIHTLRTILMTRRHHGKETYALFIDIVKAFDSVNHKALYAILGKFGIPEELIKIIKKKKMYTGCSVQIKVGKEKREIEYTSGVQQGDNMAGILFLFVIQAATETYVPIQMPEEESIEFRYFKIQREEKKQRGKLVGQNTTSKGEKLHINNSLYMDDGAFLFTTLQALQTNAQEIFNHFAKFGLLVHVGRIENGKKIKSKTEAVFFPNKIITTKKGEENPKLPEDILLNDNNNNIPFVTNFQYLGSIISDDLLDDKDIKARIKKANYQMGALRHFLKNRDLDNRVKQKIYIAGPISILLFGSESWNLTEKSLKTLRSFHHSSIRRILGIPWKQVREERITNEDVRARFCQIPDILTYITVRTWKYIGKTIRNKKQSIPQKMIGAWIHGPKKMGRPQQSCKHHFVQTLTNILPEIEETGIFEQWTRLAQQKEEWEKLEEEYKERRRIEEHEILEKILERIYYGESEN
jgi:hypothetical protein